MKWDTTAQPNQANFSAVRRVIHDEALTITAIQRCGNCNAEATVLVAGRYPRCQPCANHFVTLWNTIKHNLTEGD